MPNMRRIGAVIAAGAAVAVIGLPFAGAATADQAEDASTYVAIPAALISPAPVPLATTAVVVSAPAAPEPVVTAPAPVYHPAVRQVPVVTHKAATVAPAAKATTPEDLTPTGPAALNGVPIAQVPAAFGRTPDGYCTVYSPKTASGGITPDPTCAPDKTGDGGLVAPH